MKSFLGIDLKTGGYVILAIYIVENILIFLITAIRSKMKHDHNNDEYMKLPFNINIEVHTAFLNFLGIFSSIAITLSAFGLVIQRTKFIMWFYFFHQGIGIEILIILLPVIAAKSVNTMCILSAVPLLIFICIKCYCWLAMVSLYKLERVEERRLQFGKQWIINSLMTMQPGVRLTIPDHDNVPYERF